MADAPADLPPTGPPWPDSPPPGPSGYGWAPPPGDSPPGPSGYGYSPPPGYPPPGYPPPPYGWAPRYWNAPIVPNEVVPYLASDERTWAVFAHAGAFLGGFIVPLVIRLTKGDESRYIKDQATESLNFQLTVLLATLLCIPLMFVLIGFLLLPVILIAHWVFAIIAMVAASKGVAYRYPISLRMVSAR